MPLAPLRALLFDAGYTLLEMDYGAVAGFLRARGHPRDEAAVIEAERRARMRLEAERAAQAAAGGPRARTGEGRYLRYLLEHLAIAGEAEHHAVTEWRRQFNPPIGLCHRADGEAAAALRRAREAGCVVGVVSNSNGSVGRALDEAGLGAALDFVIDSTVVGIAKPDPRVFALGLEAAGRKAHEACYVGDSYFVDVVGARRAGLDAVLFDPGRVWGARDCAIAAGLTEAVERALNRRQSR
jgi:FMN phosphatase YigB (HAD superfamily)